MFKSLVLLAGCVFFGSVGCGSSSSQAFTATSTPPPAAPPPSAAVIVQGAGDLDGNPGDEALALHADGTLVAGALRGAADLTGWLGHFMEQHAALSVVVVDSTEGVRGVLVALPSSYEQGEDTRYQLFVPSAHALRRVLDVSVGVQESALRFPGDGSIHYIEGGWPACDRLGWSGSVERQDVEFRMAGDQFRETNRTGSGETRGCDEFAACPFVYVVQQGEATKIGEILRNLRGAKAYALQSLTLPPPHSRTVTVRLSEEKPEVTFLDHVFVLADGQRIDPVSCESTDAPLYCASDRRAHVMYFGDQLELVFELPAGVEQTELFAQGYYVPTRMP